MGVALALAGRLDTHGDRFTKTTARDWLARAAVWFEAVGDAVLDTRIVRDDEDRPTLLAAFHPAADPVELRLGSAGKLKLSAATSPAGPGYHAYLCGVLKQFATDFEFAWDVPAADDDPGRYFVTADAVKLETHFLRWLGAAAAAAVQAGPPYELGMPRQPRYTHPGPVLTPLGPRPAEWLKVVAADPARGKDFFPWWGPNLDGAFYRGRAAAELWLEFRWRPPVSEAEGEQVDQVAADLANAFDLDSHSPLPWAEWAAVIAAIETDANGYTVEPISAELKAEVNRRADGTAAPVGYRRFPVKVHLPGGWDVTVPGTFATAREDFRTWTAWEDGKSVWFRNTLLPGEDAPAPADAVAAARKGLPAGDPVPPPDGVTAAAVFGPHEEDGKPAWRLSGVAAGGGKLAACNVYVRDAADRDWAVRTWQTLRPVE